MNAQITQMDQKEDSHKYRLAMIKIFDHKRAILLNPCPQCKEFIYIPAKMFYNFSFCPYCGTPLIFYWKNGYFEMKRVGDSK